MKSTETFLKEALDNLPAQYVSAVRDSKISQKVDAIGQKHNFTKPEIDILDREVIFLVLQATTPLEFMQRLEEHLGRGEEIIATISDDVTEQIIKPIARKLDISYAPTPPGTESENEENEEKGEGSSEQTEKSSLLKDRASKIIQSGTRKRRIRGEGKDEKSKKIPYSGDDPYREKPE